MKENDSDCLVWGQIAECLAGTIQDLPSPHKSFYGRLLDLEKLLSGFRKDAATLEPVIVEALQSYCEHGEMTLDDANPRILELVAHRFQFALELALLMTTLPLAMDAPSVGAGMKWLLVTAWEQSESLTLGQAFRPMISARLYSGESSTVGT